MGNAEYMGVGFFPFLIGSNFGSDDSRGHVVFFSFSLGEMPMWRGGFWLRELQLWLALIEMQFWYPLQPAGGGFFPFLIGSNFGSHDSGLQWVPKLHLNQSQ